MLNKEIELKLGYIGVINRSKKDLDCNLPVEESLEKEKKFFKTHHIYKIMTSEYFGTNNLINKLSKIYFNIIKESMPKIINSINDRVVAVEEELEELGHPIPTEFSSKVSFLISMINEYCEMLKNCLNEKHNQKMSFLEGEGGFKIRKYFEKLLIEFTKDYKATSNYTDEFIKETIIIHEGYTLQGFPNIEAFIYLIRPQIEQLKNPIYSCFENIFQYLNFLSRKILAKEFSNFPKLLINISDLVNNFINEKKNKTKYLIDSIVNMENNYFFTNDEDYYNIEKKINEQNNKVYNSYGRYRVNYIDKIGEIKERINTYFNSVVKELRNIIPKIIGNFFVKEIEDNLQISLQNKIYESKEIVDSFEESESISQRRKELTDIIEVMKKAQNIIWKNTDLIISHDKNR